MLGVTHVKSSGTVAEIPAASNISLYLEVIQSAEFDLPVKVQ